MYWTQEAQIGGSFFTVYSFQRGFCFRIGDLFIHIELCFYHKNAVYCILSRVKRNEQQKGNFRPLIM